MSGNSAFPLDEAVRQLGFELIRRIEPALRSEAPPSAKIIGRAGAAAACLQALNEGKTVALTGPAGVGKTALGGHLSGRLASRPAFWFTLRLGLNDRLGSLLFALGHFLYGHGAPLSWLQLVADRDQVNQKEILGLVRRDLTSLQEPSPLLCFDMDLLNPGEVQTHFQILSFLASLRGLAPILVIGQQLAIEADFHCKLDGLSSAASREMVEAAAVQLTPEELADLHRYTQGNPRLLRLFITLRQAGEPLADTWGNVSGSPSLEFMLRRVWQRLDEEERDLLLALSVFRRPAPGDEWPAATLDRLVGRNLAQVDGRGGVELLPAFRAVIYQSLLPKDRQALHLAAAQTRLKRGEYTTAAYHLSKGGRPRLAVRLLEMHLAWEIEQGQGHAALVILEDISPGQLDETERETLLLLRGQLRKLVGKYDATRAELAQASWTTPLSTAWRYRLDGDIAELTGSLDEAIRAYLAGLETAERWSVEKALFHKNLGWVHLHLRRRNLDSGEREADRARYEATNLQGYYREERGDFAQARARYLEALELAESKALGDSAIGKVCDNLAGVLVKQGEFEQAAGYRERAIRCFERIGDQPSLASARLNGAFGCNQAGRYAEAVPLAEEALRLFELWGEPYGVVAAVQNLAEAHLALGNLQAAEEFASRVIAGKGVAAVPDGLRTMGEVKLAQGQLGEAEELINRSIQQAEQNQDPYLAGYAWRARGRVCLAQGDTTEAAAAFQQAIRLFEELDLPDEIEKIRSE